jgi:hypothetical protein
MPSREPTERELKRWRRRERTAGQAAPAEPKPPAKRPPEPDRRPEAKSPARFDFHRDITRWSMRLPKRELAVLLALWDRQPRDGRPFAVSHATLGACCGLAREHAARAARSLERLGLVAVVKRGDRKTAAANLYRLPERLPEPPT